MNYRTYSSTAADNCVSEDAEIVRRVLQGSSVTYVEYKKVEDGGGGTVKIKYYSLILM
jgi:hypothetical protein